MTERTAEYRGEHPGERRAAARARAGFVVLLAAALVLAACEGITKISEVKSDPSKFRDKTVRVAGTVVNSVGILQTGGYEVEDDTGTIFVISNQGIPSKGAKVIVEGSVFSGAMVLGQSLGVAIKESRHRLQ